MLIKALEQERDTLRREGYDLGKKDGIDLGEQKGIEKGIEKGKLEAQRQTILRLVQWRFAPTAADQAHYAAHLDRIDNLEALLHLVDQVLAQPTLATFAEALQAHLPPTE